MPGLAAFLQFPDQGFHGGEIDLEPVVAGLDGEGNGQVGLADSRRPQKDHVLMFGDKGEIEQLHHGFLVQMRVKGEVFNNSTARLSNVRWRCSTSVGPVVSVLVQRE